MRIQPYIILALALVLAGAGQRATDGSISVEQAAADTKLAAELVASLDGLGSGLFSTAAQRNPSEYGVAVGPDHIMQRVNSQLVVVYKKREALRRHRSGGLRGYVGDYSKKEVTSYSTRIGAFRMPGCKGGQ